MLPPPLVMYGVLGGLLMTSEVLGLCGSTRANGVLHLLGLVAKDILAQGNLASLTPRQVEEAVRDALTEDLLDKRPS